MLVGMIVYLQKKGSAAREEASRLSKPKAAGDGGGETLEKEG